MTQQTGLVGSDVDESDTYESYDSMPESERQDALVEAAEDEGKVVAYLRSDVVGPEIEAAFEDTYDIDLEIVNPGRTSLVRQQIVEQTKAGKVQSDLVETQTQELQSIYADGQLTAPMPEFLKDSADSPELATDHALETFQYVFMPAWNTQEVDDAAAPTTYQEFLNSEWSDNLVLIADNQMWYKGVLDEPLSNLDAKLRESMRLELKRLQRSLGLTSLYVTHDQGAALALSSRIAVMNQGQIMQLGTPREIYERPSCRFVAEFIGTSNVIDGRVVSVSGDVAEIDTREGTLRSISWTDITPGDDVTLIIRPEDLQIRDVEETTEERNGWTGKVLAGAYLGDAIDYVVATETRELRCRVGSDESEASRNAGHGHRGPVPGTRPAV